MIEYRPHKSTRFVCWFHRIDPQGRDTIEGSNSIAVETSSALFISMGTAPSCLAGGKQIM